MVGKWVALKRGLLNTGTPVPAAPDLVKLNSNLNISRLLGVVSSQ